VIDVIYLAKSLTEQEKTETTERQAKAVTTSTAKSPSGSLIHRILFVSLYIVRVSAEQNQAWSSPGACPLQFSKREYRNNSWTKYADLPTTADVSNLAEFEKTGLLSLSASIRHVDRHHARAGGERRTTWKLSPFAGRIEDAKKLRFSKQEFSRQHKYSAVTSPRRHIHVN
jgi:hypothetical protein